MSKPITRKQFLRNSAIVAAALPFGTPALAALPSSTKAYTSKSIGKCSEPAEQLTISIFSKHLQWLDYREMAALAKQLGYDGIDLTVRKGGHVLPERAATDLPKAVEIIRAAGLEVYTITTDIKAADEPYTKSILKTAAALGIRNYRMGWYDYTGNGIEQDLKIFKERLKALAGLNEHYQIHGDYENHTGRFGGPIWDLWQTLKDLNAKWIGCQFDIRHATVDGAEAWPLNLELIHPFLGSIAVKDFHWEQHDHKWFVENVPLGTGMVDFPAYLKLLKKYDFNGPVSQHFEYPLGGAESGATKLSIPRAEVITRMQSDLQTLKTWLRT